MRKILIKIRVAEYSHAGLLVFAQNVYAMMTANANYPVPAPALLQLSGIISDYSDALTAWGTFGNRGSRLQHQLLLDIRDVLETNLAQLSCYCMSTTPYDKAAFLSGGWEVKREKLPVGLVGPVVDFHQFISRTVPSGAVKLSWKRPEGAPRQAVRAYRILSSLTADIHAAEQIALSTKTTFTDLEAGNRPGNFYWVIPVTVAGNGGIADVVIGYPQGPVENV